MGPVALCVACNIHLFMGVCVCPAILMDTCMCVMHWRMELCAALYLYMCGTVNTCLRVMQCTQIYLSARILYIHPRSCAWLCGRTGPTNGKMNGWVGGWVADLQ